MVSLRIPLETHSAAFTQRARTSTRPVNSVFTSKSPSATVCDTLWDKTITLRWASRGLVFIAIALVGVGAKEKVGTRKRNHSRESVVVVIEGIIVYYIHMSMMGANDPLVLMMFACDDDMMLCTELKIIENVWIILTSELDRLLPGTLISVMRLVCTSTHFDYQSSSSSVHARKLVQKYLKLVSCRQRNPLLKIQIIQNGRMF